MTIFDKIKDSYNKGAKEYSTIWNKPHDWLIEERDTFIEYFKEKKSFLEIGCGPGHDSYFWSQNGLETFGIDISKNMIKIAKDNYPNVRFQTVNFFEFDFKETYDVIWCSYSLLHVPVDFFDSVLNKINNLLNEEGYLFLSMGISNETLCEESPIEGLFDSNKKPVSVYIVRWNMDELKSILNKYFNEIWFKTSEPFPGVSSYSGLWGKL